MQCVVGPIHELPLPTLVTSYVQGRSRAERACSGGTCLSRPQFNDRRCLALRRARQACPSESSFGGTCLSGPSAHHWTKHVRLPWARPECTSWGPYTNDPHNAVRLGHLTDLYQKGDGSAPPIRTPWARAACSLKATRNLRSSRKFRVVFSGTAPT